MSYERDETRLCLYVGVVRGKDYFGDGGTEGLGNGDGTSGWSGNRSFAYREYQEEEYRAPRR